MEGKPYLRPLIDAWLIRDAELRQAIQDLQGQTPPSLPKPTVEMIRQWLGEGLIDRDTAERMEQSIEDC